MFFILKKKNQAEKKYKRKYDLATPKPLGPRRKDGKNLNASHRNPRGNGSKAKGIIIDDPPPQAEQPTHKESDSETPTEQEGDDREIEEEKGDEEGGGKEGGEDESDESESDEEEGEDESGEEEFEDESDEEIRKVVQEQEVQQQDQGGDAKEKGKKKEGPKKKKGDHMPDPLKMFSRGPDDPPLGIPGDGGKVLWGYKHSWASVVYNTIDHKDVGRLMNPGTSVSMMRKWPSGRNINNRWRSSESNRSSQFYGVDTCGQEFGPWL